MTERAAITQDVRRALSAEEGGGRWLRRVAALGVVAVLVGGGLVYRAKNKPLPPARYVTAAPSTGDVAEKVQATGAIQPVLQVNVGAQVNGRITRVYVDFNSVVHKGDVLAEIDPLQYGQQVNQVSAQVSAQKATVDSANATTEASRIAYERTKRLYEQGLAAKGELDTALGQYEVNRAAAAAQSAQIGAIQAQLQQTQTNVGFTKIYSPVDGVVVTRSIDPGATVVASFQAPVLFVIAQDLRKMRVMADVDEADVGKLKENMESEAVVDAFPGEVFKGVVQQVRYSPTTTAGVVTYSAVVEVENPDEKLRPGMTATVTIKTREAKATLRVPNSALRYKPTPPMGPNGKPVPQPPEPPLAKGSGRVWVLTNDKPGDEKTEQKLISIGVTDGINTEVTGGLTAGAKLVTDETDDPAAKKKESRSEAGVSNTDVLISCKNLSKDYESGAGVVRALRDIDLDINQGEFVAIVGTSGSGKSTLMNILGCLDRPTRGAYELAGFDIGARSSDARAILRNRLIGFIFQGFNLLPRTTALENVELPLVYRGVSARERRKRAMESLDAVGLAERVHHTPNQLSGGQQQRVAIARALVTSPPMLLADEPTGNLDTRTSLEVLALLQRLNQDRGITIILVTHEHDIAACASRVVTFRDGRIVSDTRDTPLDAAAAILKLPPADTSVGNADEAESPLAAERRRLGGPVPRLLYLSMVIGALVGMMIGNLYASAVLDVQSTWIGYAFAFFFEALAAAWYAGRSLGKPLTNDQRVRVALTYTLGGAVVFAPMTALGWMPWSKVVSDRLEALSSSGVVLTLGVVLLGLATLALARYLILALFAPIVGLPKKTHA